MLTNWEENQTQGFERSGFISGVNLSNSVLLLIPMLYTVIMIHDI